MSVDQQVKLPEETAFKLAQSAIALDAAREKRAGNPALLAEALAANLDVWVALQTAVGRPECSLSAGAKENLRRLSDFVAEKTFLGVDGLDDDILTTLVNINLQISEGLLEGGRVA